MRYSLMMSATVLALDQLTKWLALQYLTRHVEVAVTPFLNLTLVYNRGAAFGFLNDAAGWQHFFFVALALIASAVIVYLLHKTRRSNPVVSVALALILGGAIGNLVDRLVYGHVVDFIDIYVRSWHWPAFNVADSAISVGAALLVVDMLSVRGRTKPV